MLSPRLSRSRAFTLLEVMVAIALLAVGMTVLLQVQTRSVQMAMQAREMTVATMLARGKLLDCETDFLKKGFSIGDYNESGSFDEEGYPTFYWECHAYKPDMPVPSAGDITGALSAGAGDEAASAADEQGAAGMGMLAPLFSQVAGLLGDSIRELHVIVRYGEGADQEEMTVTTHVIDKTSVNSFATMVAGMCQAPGGGGGGGGDGGGAGTGRGVPGVPGGAPRPGVGGLPGGVRP